MRFMVTAGRVAVYANHRKAVLTNGMRNSIVSGVVYNVEMNSVVGMAPDPSLSPCKRVLIIFIFTGLALANNRCCLASLIGVHF